MAGAKTEMTIGGGVVIETESVTVEISTLTESTLPCANIVTAQSWSALPASLWISSCSLGHAAIASKSRTRHTSNEAMTALPRSLKWRFTSCKTFAN